MNICIDYRHVCFLKDRNTFMPFRQSQLGKDLHINVFQKLDRTLAD